MYDGEQSDLSHEFLVLLDYYDYVVVAGEAETHCVLETVGDLVALLVDDADRLGKISVLRDCMSPVIHPEIDFHAMALAQFAEWEGMGLNVVVSTDPPAFLK